MKFSDIDFSAISRMMDNMSDEEKNKLNDMAQNMMNNMKQNEEPEEETDFYEALNINEEDYVKQLHVYSDYVKNITKKDVKLYLYSILEKSIKEII